MRKTKRPLCHVAFINKNTLNKYRDCECKYTGKITDMSP